MWAARIFNLLGAVAALPTLLFIYLAFNPRGTINFGHGIYSDYNADAGLMLLLAIFGAILTAVLAGVGTILAAIERRRP